MICGPYGRGPRADRQPRSRGAAAAAATAGTWWGRGWDVPTPNYGRGVRGRGRGGDERDVMATWWRRGGDVVETGGDERGRGGDVPLRPWPGAGLADAGGACGGGAAQGPGLFRAGERRRDARWFF